VSGSESCIVADQGRVRIEAVGPQGPDRTERSCCSARIGESLVRGTEAHDGPVGGPAQSLGHALAGRVVRGCLFLGETSRGSPAAAEEDEDYARPDREARER
jgi:hypothetical protein